MGDLINISLLTSATYSNKEMHKFFYIDCIMQHTAKPISAQNTKCHGCYCKN